jgi:endo-1,3-1,4-beta-glycanase ExoK
MRRLSLVTLAAALLAPAAASAAQSSELYRTEAYFYGRFEARIRYAPGEGIVSSFFLWKDGSSSTTSWNELDYEKVNAACRLQTNIWTGKGTQSEQINTPTFDICADYHTYAFEWTPDYIAWFIDGTQIRRVTGASVTEYTKNASEGMTIHFNTWVGNSSFGGTLNASILPVRQYINWVQYSSYANGTFQLQWREDFNDSTIPTGWETGTWESPFNLSTHNPANVTFVDGIAVLSVTADNATGFSGTPPADPKGGGAGTSGTGGAAGSGAGGTGGSGGRGTGTAGSGGAAGTAGSAGRGGTGGGASPGTGGSANAGRGGTGTGGTAAGTAGNGAAGTTGTAGTGASAGTTGAAGTGTAGTTGAAGTGTAGTTGAAGTIGASGSTGGTAAAGTTGTSGTTGAAGDSGESNAGCGCRVAGGGPRRAGGLLAALLITAGALRRRRRR